MNRYVKSKRATISPNFNFLGQLLEYEKQLRREQILGDPADMCKSAPVFSSSGNHEGPFVHRHFNLKLPSKSVMRLDPLTPTPPDENLSSGNQSPISGLTKLSFTTSISSIEKPDDHLATSRDIEEILSSCPKIDKRPTTFRSSLSHITSASSS